MADSPDDRPSLAMPSFSLRRGRGTSDEAVAAQPEPTSAGPDPTPVGLDPEPVAPQPDAPARRARTAPPLSGLPVALLTGLLVGGLAVAYAWLAGAGCEAARGTSACGGAAGLPLLLAGLVLLACVGAVLLRFFRIADAGSTSILAVGVLAVLVMLFVLDALDEGWVLVLVPALAVASYGLAWWVTTSVAGDDATTEVPEPHDVR